MWMMVRPRRMMGPLMMARGFAQRTLRMPHCLLWDQLCIVRESASDAVFFQKADAAMAMTANSATLRTTKERVPRASCIMLKRRTGEGSSVGAPRSARSRAALCQARMAGRNTHLRRSSFWEAHSTGHRHHKSHQSSLCMTCSLCLRR